MGFDVGAIRRQMPFHAAHPELVYLDNAATTQMPLAVIDALKNVAMSGMGGVHRGFHELADETTARYEGARASVASFIGGTKEEIVFTKNATEALNLVAHMVGERLGEDDAIAVTRLDHHSNIVPWLMLKERRGVDVRWIGVAEDGHLKKEDIETVFRDGRVKVLAVTGQSNVLGIRPDLPALIAMAHAHNASVCIDAAQLVAHEKIDVRALDCDFLAFSGHKIHGPTGAGVLFGKKELLQSLPAFLGGGGMVREVTDEGFSPSDAPSRFEAGTPPVLPAIGLSAALDWQSQFSWKDREAHERKLLSILVSELRSVKNVRILGPDSDSISGCVSFVVDALHPHDIAEVLNREGLCVRAGHHCAGPLHKALGLEASVRVSVGLSTSEEDIRALKPALETAIKLLSR